MTDKEVYEKLNPQIEEVEIGVRQLRKIKIYPLSLADQIKITGLASGIIKNLAKGKEASNAEFLESLKIVLQENLGTVLAIITDDGEKLLGEITNVQALVIGEIIYKNNFGVLEKKIENLLKQVGKTMKLDLGESSPESSDSIPNIVLNTSSEEVGEKVD